MISSTQAHPKVPEIEQQLSAGCVCFNLVHGAHALGFAAQWVTRWYAFDHEAAAIFGAKESEFFLLGLSISAQHQLCRKNGRDLRSMLLWNIGAVNSCLTAFMFC